MKRLTIEISKNNVIDVLERKKPIISNLLNKIKLDKRSKITTFN